MLRVSTVCWCHLLVHRFCPLGNKNVLWCYCISGDAMLLEESRLIQISQMFAVHQLRLC